MRTRPRIVPRPTERQAFPFPARPLILNLFTHPCRITGWPCCSSFAAPFPYYLHRASWTHTIVWIPLPGRLPPDDLLELWTQVVARGELGPYGEYVKWTEETWEQKRRELAARPVPHADFPFPGRVATDRLHWLRRELDEWKPNDKSSQVEVLRIMRRLLRMAEEDGDADQAAYWRSEVEKRTSHTAPPPREVKR